MKNIAFKKAKNSPIVKDLLPSEFITEYADTSLFEEGYHLTQEGYEILPEDQFNKLLAKNERLLAQFNLDKQEREATIVAAKIAEQMVLDQQEEILNKEFEDYKRWKKSKGLK